MDEKPIATLTIHGADAMTRRGRLAIGRWLQLHGANLVANGNNYARLFRARYFLVGSWASQTMTWEQMGGASSGRAMLARNAGAVDSAARSAIP